MVMVLLITLSPLHSAHATEQTYWHNYGWYFGNGGYLDRSFARDSYDYKESAERLFKSYGKEFGLCQPIASALDNYLTKGAMLCLDKQTMDWYSSGRTTERLNDYDLITPIVCNGRLTPTSNNYLYDGVSWSCVPDSDAGRTVLSEKNVGRPQLCVGNPVSPAFGNKFQVEQDYASAKKLAFIRFYDSKLQASAIFPPSETLGKNWRHQFDRRIYQADGLNISTNTVWSLREDGKLLRFVLNNKKWVPDQDISDQLEQLVGVDGKVAGWKYQYGTNKEDVFDANGLLVTTGEKNGYTQNLTYSDAETPISTAPRVGLLIGVVDSFGQKLQFNYDAQGRLHSLRDPADGLYSYNYDAKSNLVSVEYPDLKIRQYVYDDPISTSAMTGVIDENSKRFATWTYDTQGRALSSEHADGVDKVTLVYDTDNTQVTDGTGSTRTYNFETVLGVIRSKGQSQPSGAGCGPASASITYDANGNVASRIDFNGSKTTYSYDLTRNLEISRTEAFGTPEARTIATTWHASYRLPVSITEPGRVTSLTYDAAGNQVQRTVTAGGKSRTWSTTYNALGQVLTAQGPRTDVADVTIYSYDAQGNLATIRNAIGNVTILSNYDANGRVGRIVNANGLITDLSYSPRGWLTLATAGGEGTSYEYDGAGQLLKITLPDGSLIAYTYDDAHRLTAVSDSLGNRITYTLDSMGNRISEQVSDPGGHLVRQTTRAYDALNRLQQQTGATQ